MSTLHAQKTTFSLNVGKSRMLSLAICRRRIGHLDWSGLTIRANGRNCRNSWFAGLATLPTLEEAALQLMNEAMRRADGNQSIASRLLGISQPALSKRLKRLLS